MFLWYEFTVKRMDMRLFCPFCGHLVASEDRPPDFRYCEHVVFLYLDSSSGDPSFDFRRPDFKAAYESEIAQGIPDPEDPEELCQSERLYKEILHHISFPDEVLVFEFRECDVCYPTNVVVALTHKGGNRSDKGHILHDPPSASDSRSD